MLAPFSKEDLNHFFSSVLPKIITEIQKDSDIIDNIKNVINNINNDDIKKLINDPQEYMNIIDDVAKYNIDDIIKLINELDISKFISPFDWKTWSKQQPQDWHTNSSLLKDADFEYMRCIMTAHIRLERTQHGHLDYLFRSGYMKHFFVRLLKLAKIHLDK